MTLISRKTVGVLVPAIVLAAGVLFLSNQSTQVATASTNVAHVTPGTVATSEEVADTENRSIIMERDRWQATATGTGRKGR